MNIQSIQTFLSITATDNDRQAYFDTIEAIVRVCQEAGRPSSSALHQFKQIS